MFSSLPSVGPVSIAVSALALVSCGGGGSSITQPPTPGPTASATPTPQAAPTPLPRLTASCAKLGPGSPTARCPRTQASFQREVDDAILYMRGTKPEIFSHDDVVLSTGQFLIGIINYLDGKGICAGWDGEELAVKTSDDFNDQYDILTANQRVRPGEGAYRTTCFPASYPLDIAPAAPTPDCPNLPPSREITCGRENWRFYPDVEGAIEQLLKTKPEYFDFSDMAARTDWPKIVNQDAYVKDIIAILKGKGYCARWDGKELQVKNTSQYNEQYAIILSFIWVRRGEGIYRSTCYPSTF